jgi:hypothetical protein
MVICMFGIRKALERAGKKFIIRKRFFCIFMIIDAKHCRNYIIWYRVEHRKIIHAGNHDLEMCNEKGENTFLISHLERHSSFND